jgi:hypothetical protein
MGLFMSGRSARALVCALSTAALLAAALSSSASAAFLTVYGGPTYSTSTGGYVASSATLLGSPDGSGSPGFGDVNDAGVAFGNFFKADTPLTSTPMSVRQVGVRWSASQSPTELSVPNSESFQPTGMNSSGLIVGGRFTAVTWQLTATGSRSSNGNGTSTPAIWPTPAAYQQLSDLAGVTSSAVTAVNAQGVAIGAVALLPTTRPVRWSAAGTPTALDMLGLENTSLGFGYPTAINDSGTTVGLVGTRGPQATDPVRWDAGGTSATKLGNLGVPAGKNSIAGASAINNAGTIVGYATKFDGSGNSLGTRPVRWDAGSTTAIELGNLGVNVVNSTSASAIKVNDAGAVLGNAFKNGSQNNLRGVRWDPGSTTPVELKAFDEGIFASSHAYDMNSSGIAVGMASSTLVSGASATYVLGTAVYWGADGVPVNLNSLIDPASGWNLQVAVAISDTGWILGVGKYGSGSAAYDRAFLLQVPEPSAMVLGLFGAVAALALHRRLRPT